MTTYSEAYFDHDTIYDNDGIKRLVPNLLKACSYSGITTSLWCIELHVLYKERLLYVQNVIQHNRKDPKTAWENMVLSNDLITLLIYDSTYLKEPVYLSLRFSSYITILVTTLIVKTLS